MSNADIGKTIAQVLGLKIPFHGSLMGRVVEEALPGGANPTVEQFVERATPDENGLTTVLVGQRVGSTRYFDAAGFPAGLSAWMSAKPQAVDASRTPGGKMLFHPAAQCRTFCSPQGVTSRALILFRPCPIPLTRRGLY